MNCKQCTQPTYRAHSRTRDVSCVAQELSHRVRTQSVSHRTVILHVQQSMSHASTLLYPSHLSTTSLFHMHSSPTLFLSIYQSVTDVIFTQGFTLRRSIECVFRSYGRNARACMNRRHASKSLQCAKMCDARQVYNSDSETRHTPKHFLTILGVSSVPK